MSLPPEASVTDIVQAFLTDYLPHQRALSARTVGSYGEALRLLLEFIATRDAKAAAAVHLGDFSAERIQSFLQYLQHERHNSVHSRNVRLAALRCFLRFAAPWDRSPRHAVTRALAVPMMRFERPKPGHLSHSQMQAIIGTHDGSWIAQRDHLLLSLLYNSAGTVSEIVRLRVDQLELGAQPSVNFRDSRRARTVPLWPETVLAIHSWLAANPRLGATSVLLPNQRGAAMTATCVRRRLAIAVRRATRGDAELARQHVSPRSIRHSASIHLLQRGTDLAQITRWLGHDTPATMHNHARAVRRIGDRLVLRLPAREVVPRTARPSSTARSSSTAPGSDARLEFDEAL